MYPRLLLAVLVGLLTLEPTFGQVTADSYRGISTSGSSKAGARDQNGLRLKGVLISESSRSALIGGRPVQEGDRIGGAKVLRIEQQGVRVRMGSEEFTVKVGGSFAGDLSAPAFVKAPARPARPGRHQASSVPTQLAATPTASEALVGSDLRHAVQAGETLSEIALNYLKDGITVEQMMMAVFQSNPGAFRSNINVLYAGATLSIPSDMQAASQEPTMAAAAVARHLEIWRIDSQPPVTVAAAPPVQQYGPVAGGETLSAIALHVLQDGVTLDQMMIVLYEANPQAFSNTIIVLYEGAVLRIPNDSELWHQAPDVATAEVVRQTRTWQTGIEQQALSAPPQPAMMAAADLPVD